MVNKKTENDIILESLDKVLNNYEDFRTSFGNERQLGTYTHSSLLEYEARLVDMKADIRPIRRYYTRKWQERDDKSASAIKYRIAVSIHKGTYRDNTTKEVMFPECTINQAEKFANGSPAYKDFINQRAIYREALVNITDLKGDIESYINLIKDLLKSIN